MIRLTAKITLGQRWSPEKVDKESQSMLGLRRYDWPHLYQYCVNHSDDRTGPNLPSQGQPILVTQMVSGRLVVFLEGIRCGAISRPGRRLDCE
jgi:hypothetical protein